MKKKSYINILKENLQEADVTKTSDVLGPMVEPILGYGGDGELKTHQNVSDILKKYYFESDNDGMVNVDDAEYVSDGEKDQKDIDKVKGKIEKIINSKEQTDNPSDKILDEMVISLEDILLSEGEGEGYDEVEEENIDKETKMKLESLLDGETDASDEVDSASDDVVLDPDSKTQLESALEAANVEKNDDEEVIETKGDGKDEEDELDVDDKIAESFSTKFEEFLSEDAVDDTERIISNIENILDEQDIVGIESPATEVKDEKIDAEVDTKKVENSVLEWLIMEIEDKADADEEVDASEESDEIDNDVDADELAEALSIFDKDEFKVSKIDSSKIRV